MSTYREYFGMSGWPFEKQSTPENFYPSKQAAEVEEKLLYLGRTRGIGLLTGEVGCGKTTLARRFVESLSPTLHKIIYVKHTTGHVIDVLKTLAAESGACADGSRSTLFRAIQDEFTRLSETKRLAPVVVIDEAQGLRNHVLEELRLLTNFRMDTADVMTLVLVGQTVIVRKLELGAFEPLASRIVMRAHIGGLTREEISPYIERRLAVVGITHPVFTEPSIEALFRLSKGVARKVNLLAHHAFRLAHAAKAKIIDAEHVKGATVEIIG